MRIRISSRAAASEPGAQATGRLPLARARGSERWGVRTNQNAYYTYSD